MRRVPIFFKVHGIAGKEVLAACDKELCGKVLKQGEMEFFVSEVFYKGEETSKQALKAKFQEFDNINLVGNKVVSAALEENLVSKECVIEINGVKHVQIFKI